MKRIIYLLIGVICIAAFIVTGCSKPATTPEPAPSTPAAQEPEKTFDLSFATYWSEKSPKFNNQQKVILEEIEQNSNGRIKFTVFASGALGGAEVLYDACATGKADVVYAGPGHTPGRFPLTELLSLPGVYEPTKENADIILTLFDKMLYKEYKGTQIISLEQTSPMYIYTTGKVIETLDDVSGVKCRCVGTMRSQTLEALGGVPVMMGLGDVYLSLQTGVIDGAVTGPSAIPGFKLTEVLDNVMKFDVGCGGNFMVVNPDVWESLPADLQEIMETSARKLTYLEYELYKADDELVDKQLKEKGGQVNTLTPEQQAEWLNAVQPVVTDYIEQMKADGQPIEEALDILREGFAKIGKEFPY